MLDFFLDDGRRILSHLGMTGTWLISKNKILEKHTHFQIKSEDMYLAYVDPRRFGHMHLYTQEQAQLKLSGLGHDLLAPEFDFKYFKDSLLKYQNRAIKVSLLDQRLFAGTGNYIANEICAHGRVLPHRLVKSITETELKKLYKGIDKVLSPTINSGGTTFAGGYRDSSGNKGSGVNHLVVFYQKICQLCKKENVVKTVLGQRGTYHCPRCQR